MTSGSVDRQEREFLAAVIRQLPHLSRDTRQMWIDRQSGRLADALESALKYDYKRTCWDRLAEAIGRVTKSPTGSESSTVLYVMIEGLRDTEDEAIDEIAKFLVQRVAPQLLSK